MPGTPYMKRAFQDVDIPSESGGRHPDLSFPRAVRLLLSLNETVYCIPHSLTLFTRGAPTYRGGLDETVHANHDRDLTPMLVGAKPLNGRRIRANVLRRRQGYRTTSGSPWVFFDRSTSIPTLTLFLPPPLCSEQERTKNSGPLSSNYGDVDAVPLPAVKFIVIAECLEMTKLAFVDGIYT
ncbi:uncharacterized protein BT62DRAFT_1010286 [Guyanagaster necrorhizus]|uniref:Uncharacterized protein n=1 Tax=Guyanagaster necrorhizus TaxID=856835 RepID=A0A9P7VMG3_9AGAR|nr:uncharacterized protein BT62DRAFT_1010286 [Guyanagaster necrorhizus MCA 3950]KAG7442646.1 hypothetical protein BT62DRAFT_1010286 [Guyanagaster necrorhizus MCA 3950]